MTQIIRGIEQGTPEWFELRRGRLTASHAQEIGNAGKGLETLCRKIAAQIFTGEVAPQFKNEAMRIGNEEEQYARIAYEMERGVDVEQITFCIFNEYVGASPDGLVGTDGGVEIKCKTFEKHAALLLGAETFEPQYVWQCHMNMLVSNRKWWDLCSYNPLFKQRSLYGVRIERDSAKDAALLAGFEKGEALIKEYLHRLTLNRK